MNLLTTLSFVLLAAHAMRVEGPGAALFWLFALLLPLARGGWRHMVMAGLLFCGVVLWAEVAVQLVGQRLLLQLPWYRLAAILSGVLLVTLAAALLQLRRVRALRGEGGASGLAFLLVVAILAVVRQKAPFDILLFDRFYPGGGWVAVFLLGCYASWLLTKMAADGEGKWRRLAWSLFSLVFFLQLGLGLLGLDVFLMTGKLHLPIPALIVAGPLYRGEGLFMLVLFAVTILLVGPAWCSHLCYIGAWDNLAAHSRKRPAPLPGWTRALRWAICGLVFASPVALKVAGVPTLAALLLAAVFGLGGLAVMALWSRQSGTMAHCTVYCPMGLLATLLGRINPWRVVIAEGCCSCGLCSRSCRYGALSGSDIRLLRAGQSCSLCGDCLGACPHGHLHYRFPGLSRNGARTAFLVMAVTLHAVFLGVARL